MANTSQIIHWTPNRSVSAHLAVPTSCPVFLLLLVNRTEGKQSAGGVRELEACKEEVILLPFLILRYLEISFSSPLSTLPFVAGASPGISILHEAWEILSKPFFHASIHSAKGNWVSDYCVSGTSLGTGVMTGKVPALEAHMLVRAHE